MTSAIPATKSEGRGWTMYLGDCLEVMPTLDRVAHVITDPPYEAEAHTKSRRSRRGPPGDKGGFVSFPIDFVPLTDAERVAAGAHFARICARWTLVFCQMEGVPRWRAACEPHGLRHIRSCVWVKPDGAPQFTGDRPGTGYECIEVLHAKGASRWNGGGTRGVFTHNCNSQTRKPDEDHQTPKPVPLMVELVDLFTDPGEMVLDAFAGSGTTGVACLRLGRRFIGIEKDPKYYALACERLRAEENGSTLQAARAGQLALLGGTQK